MTSDLYTKLIISYVGGAMSLLSLAVWTIWIMKNRDSWGYGAAPLTLSMNYVSYYLAAALDRWGYIVISNNQFQLWSAFGWSYSITLIFGLGLLVLSEHLHFGQKKEHDA